MLYTVGLKESAILQMTLFKCMNIMFKVDGDCQITILLVVFFSKVNAVYSPVHTKTIVLTVFKSFHFQNIPKSVFIGY